MAEWNADYMKMMEEMIYEENKPSFADLINNLSGIENKIAGSSLAIWTFFSGS